MDIDINVVLNLYKEKLSNTENELILCNAHIIALQEEVERLNNLLKETQEN